MWGTLLDLDIGIIGVARVVVVCETDALNFKSLTCSYMISCSGPSLSEARYDIVFCFSEVLSFSLSKIPAVLWLLNNFLSDFDMRMKTIFFIDVCKYNSCAQFFIKRLREKRKMEKFLFKYCISLK